MGDWGFSMMANYLPSICKVVKTNLPDNQGIAFGCILVGSVIAKPTALIQSMPNAKIQMSIEGSYRL
ncbi:hypothetical protein DSCO28_28010 [Desulfosarcina ovata subsp. sediminis]|uniref:Uncharacterized protein n=2 Tax=Desulfosarcina ovata TaxID=83564 RepID=A0A5K7ZNR2_9BACT|nr:hypothetical protein DSCO28_28010 [Desulfosarcina ovata subsp. sediminis]